MEIRLNEQQSKILIDIALKDLLPKELERLKKEKQESYKEVRTVGEDGAY